MLTALRLIESTDESRLIALQLANKLVKISGIPDLEISFENGRLIAEHVSYQLR